MLPRSCEPSTVATMTDRVELLTVRQVADRLAVSDSWVRRHALALDGRRVGKLWRFPTDAVDLVAGGGTVADPCHPRNAPAKSPYTAAPTARTASDGATTTDSTRSAATETRKPPTREPSKSDGAFARRFPQHAKYARSLN